MLRAFGGVIAMFGCGAAIVGMTVDHEWWFIGGLLAVAVGGTMVSKGGDR